MISRVLWNRFELLSQNKGHAMNIKSLILILVFLVPGICGAEDDKYKICFVNGYFSGADDKFMMGLASHIMVKKKLYSDPMCTAAHRVAYEVGERFSKTGKHINQSDEKITSYAAHFSSKVYNSIVAAIDY